MVKCTLALDYSWKSEPEPEFHNLHHEDVICGRVTKSPGKNSLEVTYTKDNYDKPI